MDAVRRIEDIARNAIEGERWIFGTKEYCAVVTLNVRKAFNSVIWGQIIRSLSNMTTPPYLMEVLKDYFLDWRLFI